MPSVCHFMTSSPSSNLSLALTKHFSFLSLKLLRQFKPNFSSQFFFPALSLFSLTLSSCSTNLPITSHTLSTIHHCLSTYDLYSQFKLNNFFSCHFSSLVVLPFHVLMPSCKTVDPKINTVHSNPDSILS